MLPDLDQEAASNSGAPGEPPTSDRTIIAADGRILLFSCERFIDDIVKKDCCFVCGAAPGSKPFNDEHIIPRWLLRRYNLFSKSITLPTGERRTYDRYKVPCCQACNSLLGEKVETPVSQLLSGTFEEVSERLRAQGHELLFTWLALLFFKNHLKDLSVALDRNPAKSEGFIGDIYDWAGFHHVHALARSAYSQASLLPGVVGSIHVFEIEDGLHSDAFDYLTFSFAQVVMVRLGRVGIVAVLNDAGAASHAWAHKIALIDGPISVIQLKEVAAMFAVANDDLIERPEFGTMVADWAVILFARLPREIELPEFDPEKFGDALLFALRELVAKGVIEVDGTRDPDAVAAKIRTGRVRFLTDEEGRLRRDFARPAP